VDGTNRRLKPIDVEFMRRLHTKVNLIPVIAKSDTLTEDEVALFKKRVSLSLCLVLHKLTADPRGHPSSRYPDLPAPTVRERG